MGFELRHNARKVAFNRTRFDMMGNENHEEPQNVRRPERGFKAENKNRTVSKSWRGGEATNPA